MTRLGDDDGPPGATPAERVRDLVVEALVSDRTPEEVCAGSPDLIPLVREGWARARAVSARIDAVLAPVSGAPATAARRIPGYEIESVLGRGGMGVVYRARRDGGGGAARETVAVKLVHEHLVQFPGFRERFRREAEIGRRVEHANVVRTLDVGAVVEDGVHRPFLVLEHVEGQTLRTLLREMTRVPEELVRHVGREVAKGLAAIHAAGAVHRDLKPDNVLITRDHGVKVMDLGVAKSLGSDDHLSAAAGFVGSLRYAAPEQLERTGPAIDGRADLHALGVTLYELATGRHPFEAEDVRAVTRAILEETPRRAGAVNAQLSPFLEELLACLLEKPREARFADAGELAVVLEEGERSAWWTARSRAIRAATHRPPRKVRVPRETALHGRQDDVARLSALFARARSGEGQIVLLEGEAGIGKSRLVDEFAGLLRDSGEDLDVLVGGYAPGGAATANSAFAIAFRDHLGEERLDAALAEHLDRAAALAPAFASLLRGETPPPGQQPLTKDALQTAFVRTTQSLARRRPLLVVVEDLHFAPAEGRALFAALALAITNDRVLLVGTARRRLDETWAAEVAHLPHASRISLERLAPDRVTALLGEALRSPSLAERLAPLVSEKSDGNPFFVFEILRDLRERRLIEPSADGAWMAAGPIGPLRSPSSIRDLIEARVAKLSEEDREILHVAACCGFEFDPLLVGEVVRLPALLLLRRLGALETSHRLVRSAGRRYEFDHHQVQEVLHDGLSQVHREACHAAVAEALERTTGAAARPVADVEGALCVRLASHFLRGGLATRALRYFDRAVTHLTDRHEYGPAAALLRGALAEEGLLTGVERVRVLLRHARCVDVTGSSAEELASLEEATRLADESGDPALRARTLWVLGEHLTRVSRYEEAVSALEQSIALYRETGDVSGEVGASGHLAVIHTRLARFGEALAIGERCLAAATDAGDLKGEEMASTSLAMSFHMLGRFAESRERHERSLAICRQLGEPRGEARSLSNLANVLHSMGLYAEALSQHLRAEQMVHDLGDRLGQARSAVNLALLLYELGSPDEATRRAETGRALARECGAAVGEVVGLLTIAEGLADEGPPERSRARFEEALAAARAARLLPAQAQALTGLGVLCASLGEEERAVALLDEAIGVARASNHPSAVVVAEAERAALPGGDPARANSALDALGPSVAIADRMRTAWLLWRATGDRPRLAEARAHLEHLLAHAPAESRERMRNGVALHRDILAAAE